MASRPHDVPDIPYNTGSRFSPETLEALLAISGALTSSLDLDVVLRTAIEHTCGLLGLDTGAIYVLDDGSLYLGATTPPLPPEFPEELRYAVLTDHPHCETSLNEARVVYLEDFRAAAISPQERAVCESRSLRSILFIPLLLKGEAIGVMIVGTTGEASRIFDDEDVDLSWMLAYQVAFAVANARLYGSLEEANAHVSSVNANLEGLVEARTEELEQANEELLAQAHALQSQARELARRSTELEEANDAKSRFLRSMSHELRTPLNSVIGFSGMMLQGLTGDLNVEQRLQLEMINGAGKHLLAIMNDLLDLSRIDAGALRLTPEPIDVAELITECIGSVSPSVDHKDVTLSVETPDPCPALVSDIVRVRQVLLNLLGNAVKFTERGFVSITVTQPAENLITFMVSDTGTGIPEEDLEGIFGEFEQALQHRDRTVEGTGLGLAVSRGLAGALGGTITAESRVGVGSTFTFVLPIDQAGGRG